MNRRIKAIYILTIFGILSFCALEGYWLYQQFFNYLQEKAAEMYLDIAEATKEEVENQAIKEINDLHAIYRVDNMSKEDTTRYSGYIAILEKRMDMHDEWVREITDSIDNGLMPSRVTEIIRFENIDVSNANNKEYQDAMTRSLAFRNRALDTDSVAKALEAAVGEPCRATIITEEPNRIWKAKLHLPENVLHPQVTVTYPYNPIAGYGVDIIVDIPIGKTIKQMALTLCIALAVAIMLITCLILQIKTIYRQQKIAEFQKDYTLTLLHELKRPIGALKLFISFMRNPKLDEEDRRAALDNGASEVENLASYFEKLRAITFSEAYDAPLSLSTFDLVDAVSELIKKSPTKIALSSGAECFVTAEKHSLLNVIANLVENAVKYSPENSQIDIALAHSDNDVEITVADRGTGIPDAEKSKIFEKFYRMPGNKHLPGIGLGLAYVKQVIESHGGNITVTDRDGGGSAFKITLPQ